MTQSKLILMDLDGTLLNDAKEVIQEDREAIINALDSGHYVYIATGRPYLYAKAIASKIDSRLKIVCFNGAVYEHGSEVSISCLGADSTQELIHIVNSLDITALFKTCNAVYTNKTLDPRFSYDSIGMRTVEGFEPIVFGDVIKVLMIQEEGQDELLFNVQSDLKNRFEVNYYKGKGIELVAQGLSKGNCVNALCEYYKVSLEDVIVFGDDVNDLSMFAVAHDRVATRNAADIVKAEATFITLGCNEPSIAHGLAHLKITTS